MAAGAMSRLSNFLPPDAAAVPRRLRELSGLQRRRPASVDSGLSELQDPAQAPEEGSRGVYRPEEVKLTSHVRLGQSKKKRLIRINSYRIHTHIGSGSFGQVLYGPRPESVSPMLSLTMSCCWPSGRFEPVLG
jgi:hypothetical protein